MVKEWLEDGNLIENITTVRPEYTYGSSRIDLYVEAGERKILIEVKGVTLEADGVVRFPDAPSERAVKHVYELKEALKKGYEAYISGSREGRRIQLRAGAVFYTNGIDDFGNIGY